MRNARGITLPALMLAAVAMAVAACGANDDDRDESADSTSAAATGSPARGLTATSGTPRATDDGAATPAGTPAPRATITGTEATLAAGTTGDVFGGDPNATPVVVGTVPAPPPGANPQVDPATIASPDLTDSTLRAIIDMNASEPGIQASRDVKVGDVFRVAVVLAGVPPVANQIGGLSSFNFVVVYDTNLLYSPTISGGSALDRNPDLNVAALGGDAAQWSCLPAPEGDADDPIGVEGDGVPEIGQAFLSCFTPGTGMESGDLVLATVEFHAIAEGTAELRLNGLATGDILAIEFAHCPDDFNEPFVPCESGTANISD